MGWRRSTGTTSGSVPSAIWGLAPLVAAASSRIMGHMDDREDVGGRDAWEWMGIEKPPWLRPDHPVAQIAVLVLVQAAMAIVAYVVFLIGSLGVAPLFQGYTGDAGAEGWVFFGGSLLVGAVIFALYPFYRWQVTGNWWFLLIASLGIPLALFFLWFVVTP